MNYFDLKSKQKQIELQRINIRQLREKAVNITQTITDMPLNGEYAYEYQVLKNHLSKKKCDEFLAKNAGINSAFIYLHGHAGIEYD